MKPSRVYAYFEIALRDQCRFCPRETGWLDDPDGVETPGCAMWIVMDEDCLDDEGECLERQELHRKELEKLEEFKEGCR